MGLAEGLRSWSHYGVADDRNRRVDFFEPGRRTLWVPHSFFIRRYLAAEMGFGNSLMNLWMDRRFLPKALRACPGGYGY